MMAKTSRLSLDGIDFSSFKDQPLGPDTLRCLRYMHDVENHTVCYLRDLLVTPAHRDPEVTTFLTLWNYEEFWHGEALGQVLEAHDERAGTSRVAAMRRRLPTKDRFAPMLHSLASMAIGESYIAVHMCWGAVNEWTTQAGYARLAAKANHPVLAELLRRIMRQEGRHIDFYASQAEDRLKDSARARKLARAALRKFWTPVGAGVMPKSEVAFLIRHLFSDKDGTAMAERIDRRVDRLPGLEGLRLIGGALNRYSTPEHI